MRHRNITIGSMYNPKRNISMPYNFTLSTFSKPKLGRRYIEVIKYVCDHPNCKRIDILRNVFKQNVNLKDSWYKNSRSCRGYHSTTLANLLYADLIDYDKKYRYHITENGMKMLIKCYQNEIDNMRKPVQMTFNFDE